ncbi:DNA-binding protein [Candidatus Dependentiae bacterium]|nr:DNA-binding protein [Candidatus Dependentiae bacterium]
MEEEIYSRELLVENKKFFFDVKENQNGRFLRITEKSWGRKSRIIIPITGVKTIIDILKNIKEYDNSEL